MPERAVPDGLFDADLVADDKPGLAARYDWIIQEGQLVHAPVSAATHGPGSAPALRHPRETTMTSIAYKRAARIHDRLSGRAQRAVEDQKKKLAEHWDRFKGMDPAIINASTLFKGLELHQRLIEMWSSVVGQCALRNAVLVFQDEIARAETTVGIGVTAGMGTQVSNARQEMHVEACQYFREEAERICKALS